MAVERGVGGGGVRRGPIGVQSGQMMLGERYEEYFLIILLRVVSPGVRAMYSRALELGYVGRRIFIS